MRFIEPRLPRRLADAAASALRPLGVLEFVAIVFAVAMVVVGYGLACLWYRAAELPLRQWRETLLPGSDRR